MKKLIICFFFVIESVSAQNNYQKVDAFVESLDIRTKKVEKIARLLTQPFEGNDSLKARAIFKWISETIEYDYKESNRRKYSTNLKLHKQTTKVVLRRKKAVCAGYSNLYEAIGKASGLNVVIITGIAKTEVEDIGNERLSSNHAWNAVKIGKEWRLLDATWGSGAVETYKHRKRNIFGKYYKEVHKERFRKSFTPYYFFPNPVQFIVDHFPDKVQWQLLPTPVAKKTFIYFPIPHKAFFVQQFTFVGESAHGIWKVDEDTPYTMEFQNLLKEGKYHIDMILTHNVKQKVKEGDKSRTRWVKEEKTLQDKSPKKAKIFTINLEAYEVGKFKMTLFLESVPLLSYWLDVKKISIPGRLDK